MSPRLEAIWLRARRSRRLHLAAVNLRLLVGFAFLPAGLKKVLGQPFTDPEATGRFHEFLHAFHDTGVFYRFVGVVQLVAATLLLTQRHARTGALLMLPVITAITVFCWSTAVYPTATVATLISAAIVLLLAWDARPGGARPLDERPWALCGVAIAALYVGLCAATGEVYRPKGGPRGAAAVVMGLIAVSPLVTWAAARWAARRR